VSGHILVCRCLADATPDAIHSHENVASLMTTPARSFLDTYHDTITELKQNFMSYVKALHASDIAARSATQCDVTPSRLHLTKDGFPILPTPWKGSQYKKKELEEWFQLYVGQHYSMRTSYSTNHYLFACRISQQWS
jgi:hypothetical protein